ncbi:MAG: hypothetical protein IIA72_17280 [Proteobacteria bacterium]|nr:hypothetical protein [Pseudomonadota bacterium]
MFRGKVVAVLAILVAACSALGTEEGEVIEKKRWDQNQNWLRRRWRGHAIDGRRALRKIWKTGRLVRP